MSPYQSIADVLGPWHETNDFNSGLIERCRRAWTKPAKHLTNQELATLLRQKIAVDHLLPFARQRVSGGIDDDTELYEGELARAIERATSVA